MQIIFVDNIINHIKRFLSLDAPSKSPGFPEIPSNIELTGYRKRFGKTGKEIISEFYEKGLINSSSRILDIGCGNGRIGMPLTKYLKNGSYVGMDINIDRINWLKENVTKKYNNVNFIYSDIYNKMYNRQGKFIAKDYRFPYPDKSFDFIVLLSVFTHMLPRDVENYLREIYRVLKVGGKCYITYFLVNQYTLNLVAKNICPRPFTIDRGDYFAYVETRDETAVGYKEDYVKLIYSKSGFGNNISISHGTWRDINSQVPRGQDIIIAQK